MTDSTITEKPADLCCYCGEPAEGNHSIHRDGFGQGPELPLCDAHAEDPTPTCEEIWSRIAERRAKGELP